MKKGSSNIEVIVSMILLILFSICVFTLITTGNNTEKRILEQNEIKNNARVAISYINTAIKQNDITGKIVVKENPNTGLDALVITTKDKQNEISTWFYFSDGYLLESVTDVDMPPNDEKAKKITKIDDFKIEKENQKISSEITYIYNDKPHTVQLVVILRSR